MPDEEGRTGAVETVDVTPNYSAMFSGFLFDARRQAESIARKSDDRVKLEDLHAVLSRLNVAASAMGSVEEVQRFRDELNEITGLVGREAERRAEDVEEEEPPVGECVPGSQGRYRFVPDGEAVSRHALDDRNLFDHVETVYADAACTDGQHILRRRDDGTLFALAGWSDAEFGYEIVRTEDAEES